MVDNPSLELLARWREGDEQAAQELFHRYAERLVVMARRRISARLGRRVDAEDVVQSACRSFFLRVRDGRLEAQPGGELWNLLTAITIRKISAQVKYHTAGKRSFKREEEVPAGSVCLVPVEAVAREPSHEDMLALMEEWEAALHPLPELARQIVTLRLDGLPQAEIARQVHRSERWVRVVLTDFAEKIQKRLELADP
jgi:RNA polymerase sigma factor (sigma-70 family)